MAYTVKMWLTCSSTSSDAVKEFAKRWTPALKASWAAIACTSTNLSDLASELNDKIKADCGTMMAMDINGSATPAVQSVEAFLYSNWIPGSGGLHSGQAQVYAVFPGAISGVAWSFVAGGTTVYIYANANFPDSVV